MICILIFIVTLIKKKLWTSPCKPQPKMLDQSCPIWFIYICMIERSVWRIFTQADSKDVEPFVFIVILLKALSNHGAMHFTRFLTRKTVVLWKSALSSTISHKHQRWMHKGRVETNPSYLQKYRLKLYPKCSTFLKYVAH